MRALSMDAVERAKSGHPGMPMGMAEIADVLWRRHLRHDPSDPTWPNRDRFVLSNGHGSMLLYALLHLSGYALSIDEIKRFRQLHSATPGHPEYTATPGVETTTGPLGQGLANAVGMAIAERSLAARFNRPGHTIIDHHTYVFVGDGCLMEGISHEACSLAGTLGLGKLICLYDDNGISIDGHVEEWFGDDTARRFEAYGWQVIREVDGHEPEAIDAALRAARADASRPSLVMCRTIIGRGAPSKADSSDVHGSPLGDAEVAATRARIGWPYAPFEIPEHIYAAWDARAQGAARHAEWKQGFTRYEEAYPDLAGELSRRLSGDLPDGWTIRVAEFVDQCDKDAASIASRKASQNCLEAFGPMLPELIGGSADLAGSNLTWWSGARSANRDPSGNYLYFGVREFGMVAIANGLALHGGFIPYSATFLVFSDYARNAIRMAALMRQRQVLVLTHDSIGLGEDGPTHQPVEQAASLRLIPNLDVWRPCDAVETAVAWACSLQRRDGPSALLLSRQNLPHQARAPESIAHVGLGGYILAEPEVGPARVVLIATGSEIELAQAAQRKLGERDIAARVVSMPCVELFERQGLDYRRSVLPPGIPRVAIEAGQPDCWHKYTGSVDGDGAVIGIDRFGESAPAAALFEYFGLTVEHIVETVTRIIEQS
ncbi:MAG: transketolase [Betaproteobacteria bacterium]